MNYLIEKEDVKHLKLTAKKLIKRLEREINTNFNLKTIKPMSLDIEGILSDLMMKVYRNHSFQHTYIEIFFMLFTKTMVLKAIIFKKLNSYRAGIKVLESLNPLLPRFLDSQKADTVHYIMKSYLTSQSLYLHLYEYETAMEFGKKGLEMAMKELSLRFQTQKESNCHHNKAKVYKVKRMFETIVLLFYDLAFTQEGMVICYLLNTKNSL